MNTREVEIFTQYKRPEKSKFLETVDKTRITEQAGYIPPKEQIESFMRAGKRLVEYRRELYDFGFGEKINSSFVDPTRSPGFDFADASELARANLVARVVKSKEPEVKEEEKPVQDKNNP